MTDQLTPDERLPDDDMANREARFALIIVGALNAVLFVIGTRSSLVSSVHLAQPWWMLGPVAYGAVAVHLFLQAIEVLRPRKFRPRLPASWPYRDTAWP